MHPTPAWVSDASPVEMVWGWGWRTGMLGGVSGPLLTLKLSSDGLEPLEAPAGGQLRAVSSQAQGRNSLSLNEV